MLETTEGLFSCKLADTAVLLFCLDHFYEWLLTFYLPKKKAKVSMI